MTYLMAIASILLCLLPLISKTIGAVADFANCSLWEAAQAIDSAEDQEGVLIDDAAFPGFIQNTSNAGAGFIKLRPDAAVRHDGSGAQSGARIVSAAAAHIIAVGSSDVIIEDLMLESENATNVRNVIDLGGVADRAIIRRNAIIHSGAAGGECIGTVGTTDDFEIYFNNIFQKIAGENCVNLTVAGVGGKVICNTFVADAAVTVNTLLALEAGIQIAIGNLAIAANVPTLKEYFNTAGLAPDSTKNCGKNKDTDVSAGTVGGAGISIVDDLLLTLADMIESDAYATINMLRKAAGHAADGQLVGAALSDLLTDPGDTDVTGATIDPSAVALMIGAHHIALAVAAGGDVPPFAGPFQGASNGPFKAAI